MLLSIVVPLFFVGSQNISFTEIGFNKQNKNIFKDLLFYIPLLFSLIPLVIFMKRGTSLKTMAVMFYFYLCVAIAAEIYFRGLIQHFLRGKFNIFVALIFAAILFTACNLYYFNRINYIKHIIVLSLGMFGISLLTGLIIEKKGLLFFTMIFNALYFFLSAGFIKSGKRLVIGQGICLAILFVYGVFMLITYMKKDKKDKIDNKETFDEEGNILLD